MHAALYLVVVMAGAAAQYILLAAEFVAWVQVIIYIGAVIILFLFGIMLTRAPMGGDSDLDNDQRWPAAVVGLFLAGVLATLLIDAFGTQGDRDQRGRRAARRSTPASRPRSPTSSSRATSSRSRSSPSSCWPRSSAPS